MIIERIPSDLVSSNMYLISDAGHAIVIDPWRNTAAAEGLLVDKLILTHEHYDHISGVNLYKARFGAEVLCSTACSENISSCRKNCAHYFNYILENQKLVSDPGAPDIDLNYSCTAEDSFTDNQFFDWRGHRFELFALPGHSMGSIGIILDGRYFFSGDSVLPGLAVELRFPGGSKRLWEAVSLPRLKNLKQGLIVYPGHFSDFILGEGNRQNM